MVQKYAAIVVQRWTRGHLCRLDLAVSYCAAREIQRIWRGYCQCVDFTISVIAAITIQAFIRKQNAIRNYKEMRICQWVERSFLNKQANKIQSAYRAYIDRRIILKATSVIQAAAHAFIRRRKWDRLKRGMILLQASFRARLVRQQRSEIVSIIARRVHHANLRAREAPKSRLGCRTNLALGILQTSDKLSEIMEAATTLEAAARLSSVCCKVFTEADASRILLDYVKKCNRSLPHMELALCVLLTLDNVTRYRAFIPSFADCFSAEVFLDEIQKFRDKDGIFCLSMDLLKRIADSNPTVMVSLIVAV